MRTSTILLVTLVVGCGGRVVDDTHDGSSDGSTDTPSAVDTRPTPIDTTPPGPPCDTCTNANCKTELDTCVASPICKPGFDCLKACPIPDRYNACANKCISDHTDPDDKFIDFVTCVNNKCKSECFPG